jgi:peptidyl-prolyl cis-trans isomerase SurA
MDQRTPIRTEIARQKAVIFFQKAVILSGARPAPGAVEGPVVAFLRRIPTRILALGFFVAAVAAAAQQPTSSPVTLDSVVAVANKHAILSSDIDDEIRLSVLDPNLIGEGALTRQQALDQLISRALIEQQIRQEDIEAIEPSQDEVNARLNQIRQQLPACVHQNCATDAGWKLFLAAHGLTSERVESYLRYRLEILSFIEQRFRQGIQVSPQQIDEYYHQTLVPQYKPGEAIPPLDQVAPRIQEILLEQQVNVLFDAWLTNLRGQGDVEILDPSLESAPTQASNPAATPAASSGAKP